METNKSQKSQKNKVYYDCSICNYTTSNKTDYNKHLMTLKHRNNENARVMEMIGNQKIASSICTGCNKTFSTKSGLWKHRKKCINAPLEITQPDDDLNMKIYNTRNLISPITPLPFFPF